MRFKDFYTNQQIDTEEQFLSELFQVDHKNWTWRFRGSEEVAADFTVGDIPYIFHGYGGYADGTWDIEFSVDKRALPQSSKLRSKIRDAFGLTGTGNAAIVMSTVASIMKEFLNSYDIKSFRFSAEERSRQSLYKRILQRTLPDWKFIENRDSNSEEGVIITAYRPE